MNPTLQVKIDLKLFRTKILYNRTAAILLWFGLSLFTVLMGYAHHNSFNNFQIFRHVFFHEHTQQNLYNAYPAEYNDVNLYGPVFGVLIAPFALLPLWLGVLLFVTGGALLFFYAIDKLPVRRELRTAMQVLGALEMMNVATWHQSNAYIAGCIILGFVFIHKGKESYAAFFILLAAFVKIYGIVGLAFFFFSDHRWKFIAWCMFWTAIFFFLPVIITPFSFLIHSYGDWYHALAAKAAKNTDLTINNFLQDISVQGMFRRIGGFINLNDMVILLPALFMFGLQYIQLNYYRDTRYRLYLLCSVLLFTVIYSSSSESPTYIIAFPAICLWYLLQPPSKKVNAFFIFAFILTSLSYSDIFTPYVRKHIVRPYSLKAIPSFITWLIICVQMYARQFLCIDPAKTTTDNEHIAEDIVEL